MARRISQPYRCEPIAAFARQLLFAPPGKRLEQVRRIERLHDQIEPEIAYPFEFISYRITGYRPEATDGALLVGEAIKPDLRLLIDTLSRSTPMPEDEPSETPEALAARLKVSTKTVARWRQQGLRWRWVGGETGYKKLVLPRTAVERFLAANQQQVQRASSYSHLPAGVREALLRRARRIAEARDVTLNQVATHLARRTPGGPRAVETIRQLLERHDAEHADDPIFADRRGPLSAHERRVIERAVRMGVRVGKIARRFRKTRATVYRVVRERRAAALRRLSISFVDSPIFARDDADEVILRPEPPAPARKTRTPAAPVDDLPVELRAVFSQPPLEPDRVRSLLVRFNYLKAKASRLRDKLDRHDPRAAQLDEIERSLAQAQEVRNRLAAASQRTLLSVARRHLIGQEDRSTTHLLELLELGQEVLAEAIEEFDASRGQAFEAFLNWSLMRNFANHAAARARAHRRLDPNVVLRKMDVLGIKPTA